MSSRPAEILDRNISLAISRDGHQLVTGTTDGTIILWDAAARQHYVEPLAGHQKLRVINSVAYSHDGDSIVSASDDQVVRFWDALSGRP
ncbi:hypothetical protein HYDPIDRAFT_104216, partial [Hydnomerulius pinastri MD-312]